MTVIKKIAFPDYSMDQAGRQRMSLPIPLGDYKLVNNRLPLFFTDAVNGTGTVTYGATKKSHQMNTSADGDFAITQTYQYHNYFAGKAQFVEFTSFDFEIEANVIKRSGYYSSNETTPFASNFDGFYLESNGIDNKHYLVIVNDGFENLKLERSLWDDPMDGTGRSRINLDFSKFNVIQANFLWLGGTGLTIAVVIGKGIYYFHDYDHANSDNADKLIFSSPNKPIRHEIRQIGAGSGEFNPVCSTVLTEGSETSSEIGSIRSVDTGVAPIVAATSGIQYLLKAVRLKNTERDVTVDVFDVDVFSTSNNDFFRWQLILNPTITGTLSFTDVTNSAIQEATGSAVITTTGGTVIGFGFGAGRSSSSKVLDSARKIGSTINGVRDILALVVTPLGGTSNSNMFGGINYKELV